MTAMLEDFDLEQIVIGVGTVDSLGGEAPCGNDNPWRG